MFIHYAVFNDQRFCPNVSFGRELSASEGPIQNLTHFSADFILIIIKNSDEKYDLLKKNTPCDVIFSVFCIT